MSAFLHHGGALDAAVRRFGGPRESWLDLSTGINPEPPPLPSIPAECWTRLPEAALEANCLDAARALYGAPAGAGIVAAPGSQALISMLPALVPPRLPRAAVLEPGYGEYRRALEGAGVAVVPVAEPEAVPADAGLAVLANPNNPDGRRFEAARLLPLADRMARRGGLLVVDEAFMDADPHHSLAGEAGREGLLVLRSFGKFFGFAGLRLGFALGPVAVATDLARRLGPWAVSGPALFAAAELMRDGPGVEGLRASIVGQARRTRAVLREGGLEPRGDTALFALVEVPDADALFRHLAEARILVRPFAGRPRWLRFGTVRDDAEAERLRRALASRPR